MINRVLALGSALALAGSLAQPSPADAFTARNVRSSGGAPVVGGARHSFPSADAALQRLGARYLGFAKLGSRLITFHVSTPMRNEAGLKAYARAASSPNSVYYRHWLTPGTIANTFGTPNAQYVATAAYFASHGFAVHAWQTRTSLTLTGHQAQIESTFGTKLGIFRMRNESFFAPVTAISLPASIGVSGISPIVNARRTHPTLMPGAPPEAISGGFANARVNGTTPAQLAEAYDLNEAYAKGYTGKGINLGIIGTGPISTADFPNYRTLFNIAGTSTVTQDNVSVNGDTPAPPTTGQCTAGTSTAPVAGCNPEDLEAQLDTEQTASLARDANVVFYLAYNGSGCNVATVGGMCVGGTAAAEGLGLADDELLQAVDDNKVDILSLSYGGCEVLETALVSLTPVPGADATGTDPTLFAELAAEGIATFVSSGDSGSASCQRNVGGSDAPNVSYPASDPNVVAVGGTTTPIGPNGRLIGPITNWGQQTKSGGAAGAGASVDFQIPSYQSAQPSVTAICTMRCVPDIALNADPFTGPAVLYDSTAALGGPSEVPIGGTSAAAPDAAGVWAVVLSACEQTSACLGPNTTSVDPVSGFAAPSTVPRYRLGNPNYLLYPILANKSKYQSVVYDITYGNDGVPPYATQVAASMAGTDAYAAGIDPGSVSAGPAFDEASGIGYPLGYQLLKYIVPAAK